MDMTVEELALIVAAIGVIGAAWKAYTGFSRLVHFIDSVTLAAEKVEQATSLILKEFHANGGRTEYVEDAEAREKMARASMKDVVLDILVNMRKLRAGLDQHDRDIRSTLNELRR